MQITFNNTSFNLVEDSSHEFLLSNKEVVLGYGITQSTLRSNQNNHKNELLEGKHWLRLEVQTNRGKQKVIHWSKKGIVRLGFFIKSKNAKEFRDWAEDYIVNTPTQPQQPTHHQILGYKSQLSQKNKKIAQLEAKIMQLQDHDVIASTVVRALQTADKYKKLQHQVKELAPLLN